MWHKAKKVSLTAGQTDIKIEFPLPIVACNLMIEYADYYENIQASSETLQCPRCSASVPANPGVCSNCGEFTIVETEAAHSRPLFQYFVQ